MDMLNVIERGRQLPFLMSLINLANENTSYYNLIYFNILLCLLNQIYNYFYIYYSLYLTLIGLVDLVL